MGLTNFLRTTLHKEKPPTTDLNEERNPFADPPTTTTTSIVKSKNSEYKPYPEITASTIPQWSWNREQCRAWLCEIYITHLQWSPRKAKRRAQRFEGFGPNIYMRNASHWMLDCGEAGKAIYAMVLGMRTAEGAVPKGIIITHGNTTPAKE